MTKIIVFTYWKYCIIISVLYTVVWLKMSHTTVYMGSRTNLPFQCIHSFYCISKCYVSSKLFFFLTETLHFYMNGIDQGVAAMNIPDRIFGVVDLYGMATNVSIVQHDAVTDRSVCFLYTVHTKIIELITSKFWQKQNHLAHFLSSTVLIKFKTLFLDPLILLCLPHLLMYQSTSVLNIYIFNNQKSAQQMHIGIHIVRDRYAPWLRQAVLWR